MYHLNFHAKISICHFDTTIWILVLKISKKGHFQMLPYGQKLIWDTLYFFKAHNVGT